MAKQETIDKKEEPIILRDILPSLSLIPDKDTPKEGHPVLMYKRVNPDAYPPYLNIPTSPGLTICLPHRVIINPKSRTRVDLGIKVIIPLGMYASIYPENNMILSHRVSVIERLVEFGNHDPLGITLINYSSAYVHLHRGYPVMQLVLQEALVPVPEELNSENDPIPGTRKFNCSLLKLGNN